MNGRNVSLNLRRVVIISAVRLGIFKVIEVESAKSNDLTCR